MIQIVCHSWLLNYEYLHVEEDYTVHSYPLKDMETLIRPYNCQVLSPHSRKYTLPHYSNQEHKVRHYLTHPICTIWFNIDLNVANIDTGVDMNW